jgi:DNA-binding NtrC family response regulator
MKVLFIDDEADLWIGRFRAYLGKRGLTFAEERDCGRALERIDAERPDVVLLDVLFPGADGRMQPIGPSLLTEIKAHHPDLPVVMITSTLSDEAFAIDEKDFEGAEFLFSKDRFRDAVGEDDPYAELAKQIHAAATRATDWQSLDSRLNFVVGNTPAMRRMAEKLILAAPQDVPVLIQGETGTGKELVAAALHKESGRSGKLVALDCGRYDGDVLESQLFGHERGAFTGAKDLHRGFFEEAHLGTLFLDEIHGMSTALQHKLLRVVQDKLVRRLGGKDDIQVDVRLVAASNRSMLELVAEGQFREDLYARISTIALELPPLRQRMEDLPQLYELLVKKLNRELEKSISVKPRGDTIEKLQSYAWPRNIRELENILRQAMVVSRANVLTPSTIELPAVASVVSVKQAEHFLSGSPNPGLAALVMARQAGWNDLKQIRGEYRRAILEELYEALSRKLQRVAGSRDLAEALGTSDGNMRQVLNEFGGIRALRKSLK